MTTLQNYNGRMKPGSPNDLYQTPPQYTNILLDNEDFQGLILEPASGMNAIVNVLIARKKLVAYYDLNYGLLKYNFFDDNYPVDNIITNPPYARGKPRAFIEHSLQIASKKVAMLLRLSYMEGQSRVKFFNNTPLKVVYVLTERYDLT